jgi:FixJ family two-component response regulator
LGATNEEARRVVAGHPNKEIAGRLGLSEMTVKVHRSQIMRKMQAKSLIDLVRMADWRRTNPIGPEDLLSSPKL